MQMSEGILRNGEVLKASTGGRRAGVPPESADFLGNRAESEDKLTCWLRCSRLSGRLSWWLSRECLMEMGPGIRTCAGGGKLEGDLWDPLETGTEERRLQQSVFCRAEGDTEGLDWEKRREKLTPSIS